MHRPGEKISIVKILKYRKDITNKKTESDIFNVYTFYSYNVTRIGASASLLNSCWLSSCIYIVNVGGSCMLSMDKGISDHSIQLNSNYYYFSSIKQYKIYNMMLT